jgi:hypothetical protein
MNDLRLIAAAANYGRRYGPGGDTDYTGFEAALARIEGALGGNPLSASPQSSGFQLAGPFRQGRHHTGPLSRHFLRPTTS